MQSPDVRDLAIIITCLDEADWVEPCVSSLRPSIGHLDAEIVIADIESDGLGLANVVAMDDRVRVVACRNGGFAHANNEALRTVDARYVLFLNPDTEFVGGSLDRLVRRLDRQTEIGLVGAKQLTPDGAVYPTMRRRASAIRLLGEALGSERLAPNVSWLCHRRLDLPAYELEQACDWTTGAFMLVRREALMSAGFMDERFFFGGEEEDLCLRIREAGWRVMHTPAVTIVHHVNKAPPSDRMERQQAYAKLQYARKNLAPLRRGAFVLALVLFFGVRAVIGGDAGRRRRSRGAVRVLVGAAPPPFGDPPTTALPAHSASGRNIEVSSGPVADARPRRARTLLGGDGSTALTAGAAPAHRHER